MIKIHEHLITGESYLNLVDILEGTNTKESDVYYYTLEAKGDSFVLVLYDKDKKQIKVEKV